MPVPKRNLLAQLDSLRMTLINCFIALGVGLIPMFFVAPFFMRWLIQIIISDHHISLNYFSPLEVFMLQIKTALLLDVIICCPYLVKKIWDFILPGLHKEERHFISSLVLGSSILFVSGVLFCVFFILPLVIDFGIGFSSSEIKAMFGISNVLTLALWLSTVFGIMFQFPLVTCSLIRSGFVSYDTVRSKRPYVVVGILIISAVLTPPDVISQVMLAVPTYLLFEAGLFLSKKKRRLSAKRK